MFAFAIYDERHRTLTLVRDPLGIKPLYVMPRGRGVLFASELKALVAPSAPELAVDPAALVASTLFYFLPEDRCAIKGVHKLPPGTWAEWRAGRRSTRTGRYWDPAAEAAAAAAGTAGGPGPVLEESVAAHLVADVPVASFLSGGLDSSLITAIGRPARPGDRGVHDHLPRPRTSDSRRCRTTPCTPARWPADLGIRLHEIEISPDVVDMLPRMVDMLDEPIGDPAAINTVLMCEAARDAGVKVLLSGMGADELFGGYRKHLACLLGAQYQTLAGGRRSGCCRPGRRPAAGRRRRPRAALHPLGHSAS